MSYVEATTVGLLYLFHLGVIVWDPLPPTTHVSVFLFSIVQRKTNLHIKILTGSFSMKVTKVCNLNSKGGFPWYTIPDQKGSGR